MTTNRHQKNWTLTLDFTTFDYFENALTEAFIVDSYQTIEKYLESIGVKSQMSQGSVAPKRGE
jgi:hypothetical protein